MRPYMESLLRRGILIPERQLSLRWFACFAPRFCLLWAALGGLHGMGSYRFGCWTPMAMLNVHLLLWPQLETLLQKILLSFGTFEFSNLAVDLA